MLEARDRWATQHDHTAARRRPRGPDGLAAGQGCPPCASPLPGVTSSPRFSENPNGRTVSVFLREVKNHLNYEHRVFNSEEFLKTRAPGDQRFYKQVRRAGVTRPP